MKCIPYHETKEQEFLRIYNLCKKDINSKKLSNDENIKLYSLGSYGSFGNVSGRKPFIGLEK
jgi:acyl-CoA-binding protein